LHFAIGEMNFLQTGSTPLDQTHITRFKSAIQEFKVFEIGGFKSTVFENAMVIFTQLYD
jgi:hypothetical protein